MATQLEPTRPPAQPAAPHIGDLLHRIVDDLKTIGKDEVELAKLDIAKSAKVAAADAGVVLLSGFVALVGLGFASAAAVDATAPLIAQLWARLLIIGALYVVLGGLVARAFAKKLSRDIEPDLQEPVHEAKKTAAEIQHGLTH